MEALSQEDKNACVSLAMTSVIYYIQYRAYRIHISQYENILGIFAADVFACILIEENA